ncbi:MAG: hypothetical protein WCO60_16890 [Verrucomicrobiota bacterium]
MLRNNPFLFDTLRNAALILPVVFHSLATVDFHFFKRDLEDVEEGEELSDSGRAILKTELFKALLLFIVFLAVKPVFDLIFMPSLD